VIESGFPIPTRSPSAPAASTVIHALEPVVRRRDPGKAGLDVLGRRHDAIADRRGAFPDAVLDQGLVGGTLHARDHRRDQRAANPR
jgi:hypothetical protein